MISKHTIDYCCEDISLIENYEQAIKDTSQIWECHHRLEIQGDKILGMQDLINLNLYWKRPAFELIFLTKSEHMKVHNKKLIGKKHTEETKKKIGKKHKGKILSTETKKKISKGLSGKHLSTETKKKLSKLFKGKHWFNNGIKNIRDYKCPKGFKPGKIHNLNLLKK